MSASAGALLERCDGAEAFSELVEEWALEANEDPKTIASDIDRGLRQFELLGLVGRVGGWDPPTTPRGSEGIGYIPPSGAKVGAVHSVIDYQVAFRSADVDLLAKIDAHLGGGREDRQPTIYLDVGLRPTGEVELFTDFEWLFPDSTALLEQIASVVDEYAVWTRTCAAIHAGAVRMPDGTVILMPAVSGRGKSTLTAALVIAGCDYLGDEIIGVRAGSSTAVGYARKLGLSAESRFALGLPSSDLLTTGPQELRSHVECLDGEVGHVSHVVMPCFDRTTEMGIERVDLSEAQGYLLENCLNLAYSGNHGLLAVCELAANRSVYRLTYQNPIEAAALVMGYFV